MDHDKPKKPRYPTSIWLPPNIRAALDAEAKEMGLERSQVIRTLLVKELRARGHGDLLDAEPSDAG